MTPHGHKVSLEMCVYCELREKLTSSTGELWACMYVLGWFFLWPKYNKCFTTQAVFVSDSLVCLMIDERFTSIAAWGIKPSLIVKMSLKVIKWKASHFNLTFSDSVIKTQIILI